MTLKAIGNHIRSNPYTMGTAIGLLAITVLATVVLGALSTKASMYNWMTQRVEGHARWKWLVGGALFTTGLAFIALCLSLVDIKNDQSRKEPPAGSSVETNLQLPSQEEQLPEGWTKEQANDGSTYYWHLATATTQRDRPNGPPPGYVREEQHEVLFPDSPLARSQAESTELPPGWSFVDRGDGRPFYWNSITKNSMWNRPTA